MSRSEQDQRAPSEWREQLGQGGTVNTKEHFQRRIRSLRSQRDGWQIASFQDDRTLAAEHYRVDKIGWHPALGPRPTDPQAVSARTRTIVLRRDGSRCQICGVGDGEPYPGQPDSTAVMTVGHVLSREYEGRSDLGNLRAECALCNEQLRSDGAKPESAEEVWKAVRKLSTASVMRLQQWLIAGHRTRDALDEAYDRLRKLAPADRDDLQQRIARMTRPKQQ